MEFNQEEQRSCLLLTKETTILFSLQWALLRVIILSEKSHRPMKETVISLGIMHGLVIFNLEEGLWWGFGRLRQKIKSKLPWTKPSVTTQKLINILHSQKSHENGSRLPGLHCHSTRLNELSAQLHCPIYSSRWHCFMEERIMAFVNGGLWELVS